MMFNQQIHAGLIALCLLVCLCVSGQRSAWSGNPAPEAGLITQLAGKVWLVDQSVPEQKQAVEPFIKIRQGDRLELEADAMVRLVYFKSGRNETWKGPARFTVELEAGKPDGEVKPEVSSMPAQASRLMSRSPVVSRSLGNQVLGGQISRGNEDPPQHPVPLSEEEREILKQAREVYRKLRAEADEKDVTPEIYLLTELADFQCYIEMSAVIKQALERQPDNTRLKVVAERLPKVERDACKRMVVEGGVETQQKQEPESE